ncbi:MAG TPA: response regulator transcription factor [Dyadobacter sp.]|jgi:DNA-binding NarL/FixJ family response regulator|nr:response regulator transcription factor [Dyadobacter sp.]
MNSHILILEDHDIVAASLTDVSREVLPGAEIRKAATFPKGLDLLRSGPPVDLVILDMKLPGGDNYAMVGALRGIQPDVRILVFTASEEPKHALHFFTAGANGFISKTASLPEVGVAIRTVMDDKKYMTEQVHQLVVESFFKKLAPSRVMEESALSPREQEVLELLLAGMPSKNIATELNMKISTVSTHKTRIFEKMQVSNIIELFRKLKPDG